MGVGNQNRYLIFFNQSRGKNNVSPTVTANWYVQVELWGAYNHTKFGWSCFNSVQEKALVTVYVLLKAHSLSPLSAHQSLIHGLVSVIYVYYTWPCICNLCISAWSSPCTCYKVWTCTNSWDTHFTFSCLLSVWPCSVHSMTLYCYF